MYFKKDDQQGYDFLIYVPCWVFSNRRILARIGLNAIFYSAYGTSALYLKPYSIEPSFLE